jgi:hypothetical protein
MLLASMNGTSMTSAELKVLPGSGSPVELVTV